MRRILTIVVGLAAVAALVAASASGEGDDDGTYKVRAYFDSAGFLVNGEEVRIAGATVGTVDEVATRLEELAAVGISRVYLQHLNHDDDALIRLAATLR